MRILISADIEGISGVMSPEQTSPGSSAYERARLLMTREVNAAVEGALEGGATEIWVADGHGQYNNILLEELHPSACLVSGKPRLFGMLGGLDCGPWDGMFLIGYHARAGAYGVLAHTINGSAFAEVRINGVPAGEYYLNGLLAGEYDIPVRLLSGDDRLAEEAASVYPHAEIVTVKRALSTRAAVHQPIETVHKAMRNVSWKPFKLAGPFTVQVSTVRTYHADLFCMLPGVQRLSPTCLEFTADTAFAISRTLNCFSSMAASVH
ncbi:M55 family metallopeptidase [uncultured Bilophila sp.]|uniref:M55 family metallopeptidase n=1 Tax=uncultured Bilophila sp. TaxID=529385 RepID=UPI00280C06B5|nr:M55 family metallopeptidase [uncultured Bilophila sp.]